MLNTKINIMNAYYIDILCYLVIHDQFNYQLVKQIILCCNDLFC